METVKAFNAELSSLYEVKPPISKAKMTSITRGAIKAIKFYKHVVQSVEKFILKCRSEYKVPGLYVIDSIVRQSRHQFGTEKDVFAPRFSKNIQQTFVNLFKCPPEDKSKIIRVLNLWQKNQVFPADVVQPLFDLADPNNPIYRELENAIQANGLNNSSITKSSPVTQKTPTKAHSVNDSQGIGSLNLSDPNILAQLQQLQRLIVRSGETKNEGQVHFDRKLLDFDYGDEEEDVNPSPKPTQPETVASLLTNPEVLRQLQAIQQTMHTIPTEQELEKLRKLQEMKQQEEEFDKHLAQTVPNLPFASECDFKAVTNSLNPNIGYYLSTTESSQALGMYKTHQYDHQPNEGSYENGNDDGNDIEVITLDHGESRSPSPRDDRYSSRRRRSRSRDDKSRDRRDRDRRSKRSRSRSKTRRHRSRSREREKERVKEKERDTEKERERKKRGLPPIKKDNLSVCSTTLWVGHLSKLVHQDDLSNTFGEFGDIVSIDLIPPRGCAFIVMHRRQDAARCLTKLKNHLIHSKAITLAWAPGKGVKGKDLKDYWEGDLGVSYIPLTKIKPDIDLEMLEDGGMIDEDTMPEWMKEKVAQMGTAKPAEAKAVEVPPLLGGVDTSQPPPMSNAGLLPPPPMSMPMVNPFQFNNRLMPPQPNMMNLAGMMSNMQNMPNIPLGVPPPNLQPPPIIPNQLLGIGSPFQGPGLLPPPPLIGNEADSNTPESKMKSLTDSLMSLSQPFGLLPTPTPPMNPHHEDNMDIEMEDVDKMDKIFDNFQSNPPPVNNWPKPPDTFLEKDDHRRDKRDGAGRDRERERERERDRDRDRNSSRRSKSRDRGDRRDRSRRSSRDRDKERDRGGRDRNNDRNDRDRDRGRDRRDDRRDRDRNNRWTDRDSGRDLNRGNSSNNNNRADREKVLNERLQELANCGVKSSNQKMNEDDSNKSNKFGQNNDAPLDVMQNLFLASQDKGEANSVEHSIKNDFLSQDDKFLSNVEQSFESDTKVHSMDQSSRESYHFKDVQNRDDITNKFPTLDFIPPPVKGTLDFVPPPNLDDDDMGPDHFNNDRFGRNGRRQYRDDSDDGFNRRDRFGPPRNDFEQREEFGDKSALQVFIPQDDFQEFGMQRGPHQFGPGGPPHNFGGSNDFGPGGPNNFEHRDFGGPPDFGRGGHDFGRGGRRQDGPPDFGGPGPRNFGPGSGPPDFGLGGPDFGPGGPPDFGPGGPSDFVPGGPPDFGSGGPPDFGPGGPPDFGPGGPPDFGPGGPPGFGPGGPPDFGPGGPPDFGPGGPPNFGPGGPPDFGPRGPPDFGPGGPTFPPGGHRGGFGPRDRFNGPGFMRRGSRGMRHNNPRGFFPRGGGHMRGPRHGAPWMDRPMNFKNRFDGPRGPPDFFRGGPHGASGGRHWNRGGRDFGQPEFQQPGDDFQNNQGDDFPPAIEEQHPRPGRKSRWTDDNAESGSFIPPQALENNPEHFENNEGTDRDFAGMEGCEDTFGDNECTPGEENYTEPAKDEGFSQSEQGFVGETTPLHDEQPNDFAENAGGGNDAMEINNDQGQPSDD